MFNRWEKKRLWSSQSTDPAARRAAHRSAGCGSWPAIHWPCQAAGAPSLATLPHWGWSARSGAPFCAPCCRSLGSGWTPPGGISRSPRSNIWSRWACAYYSRFPLLPKGAFINVTIASLVSCLPCIPIIRLVLPMSLTCCSNESWARSCTTNCTPGKVRNPEIMSPSLAKMRLVYIGELSPASRRMIRRTCNLSFVGISSGCCRSDKGI